MILRVRRRLGRNLALPNDLAVPMNTVLTDIWTVRATEIISHSVAFVRLAVKSPLSGVESKGSGPGHDELLQLWSFLGVLIHENATVTQTHSHICLPFDVCIDRSSRVRGNGTNS